MSKVCAHRTHLKDNLIAIFKSDYSSEVTSFKVINERGEVDIGDGLGVTRDVIATFWQQFFAPASVGDKEKVPCFNMTTKKVNGKAL